MVESGGSLDFGLFRVTITNGVSIGGTVAATNGVLVLEGAQTAHLGGRYFGTVEVQGDVEFAQPFAAGTFSASAPACSSITFQAGEKFVFDSFLLNGTIDEEPRMTLASTSAGWAWQLEVGSRANVAGVIVSDSDASSGIRVVDQLPGRGEGENNQNWLFGVYVNYWVGTYGTDWSRAANWSLTKVPTADMLIEFDAAATIEVPAGYTAHAMGISVSGGTVTLKGIKGALEIESNFDVLSGGVIELNVPTRVKGNAFVRAGGKLTHSICGDSCVNKDVNLPIDNGNALILTVDGDLTVLEGGAINLEGKAYTYYAEGTVGHGARSEYSDTADSRRFAIGSIFTPTNVPIKQGGYYTGGGRTHLTVRGTLTAEGDISAKGSNDSSGSTGGSIWINASRLRGAGAITVRGGVGNYGGGIGGTGGRIAIYLTDDETLDLFEGTIEAYGSPSGTNPRMAGTVYIETAADRQKAGTLYLSNNGRTFSQITGGIDLPVLHKNLDQDSAYKRLAVSVMDGARLYLTRDLTIRDLILGGKSDIRLNGHVLYVTSRTHRNFRGCTTNGCSIVTGTGGRIEWISTGARLIFK